MKRTLFVSAAFLICAICPAQNLNPEVQVTNDYVSEFSKMPKQGVDMTIPDSLHRFDYHFDYAVFDSPYKGAYEFSPYSVTVKPDATPYDGHKLYARLGAGYTIRPELDVVWTPVSSDKFKLNVVEKAGGFYGSYRTFDLKGAAVGRTEGGDYDFSNHTALDGRVWFGRSSLKFDLGYDGIFTSPLFNSSDDKYHSAFVSARIKPSDNASNRFYYELGLNYRLSKTACLTDNNFLVDGKLGGEFSRRRIACLLDFKVAANAFYSGLDLAPHADFTFGPVGVRLGARLGFGSNVSEEKKASVTFYPDVTASVNVVKNCLQAFAFATGGPRYNSYYDFKSFDHHYYSDGGMSITRDRLDVGGGLRGQIASRLQYSVKAGYKIMQDAPLYSIDFIQSFNPVQSPFQSRIFFYDYNTFYVDASLQWKSERVDVDGNFLYLADNLPLASGLFAPAPLSGGLHFKYNWDRRLFFSLGADAASARTSSIGFTIPWYVDLGAGLEFKFARGWSVYMKGGNLLNMDVRRTPLYSEYGVSVIAGVCLIL